MATEYEIRSAIHHLWACHPSAASTFSPCKCGRGAARGGYLCATCAEEALAKLVGADAASEYHGLVKLVRAAETYFVDGGEKPALLRA